MDMKTSDEILKPFDESCFRCGYCGEKSGVPVFPTTDIQENIYTLMRCLSCGAISLHPMPAREELEKVYNPGYYGESEQKFTGNVEKILDLFRMQRARRLHRLLGGKGEILDIGCGNGRFLSLLGSLGKYTLYGIERDGGSARRAMRIPEVKLSVGDLDNGDFPDESLDAVTLFHVFEHLEKPRVTIETIQRILRPGGILILSFPNIESHQSALFRGHWFHLDPPRHLFFFSPFGFKSLITSLGFRPVNEIHFHPDYNPYGFVQSLLNRLTGRREMLYEYLKGNIGGMDRTFIAFQIIFAACFAPLALITDIFDSLCHRGATVEFVFRKE
jgi:SAM-dependent methyltransferase